MGKLFRITSVNGDGTDANTLIEFEVIDPGTSRPFVDEHGAPSVVITLKPVSPTKYRQIVGDHTERMLNKRTRQMEDVTDWDAVQDALCVYAVQAWRGLIGADDKPLDCCYDAKVGLPGDLKNDIVQRAMQGESVDPEASFRTAAGVR
jgi:hypothetical protein